MQRHTENTDIAPRVFVVGLDGATFDLIQPWVDEGKLPHLARLMRDGSHGTLASTIPPISAPAWTSFMTGVNPGKHGIYHFQEHLSNSYRTRLLNGSDVQAPTLWRILTEAGKDSIALNVAMTYPADEIRGVLISGVDAPGLDSKCVHPPDVLADLRAAVGEYIIEPGVVEHCRSGHPEVAFSSIMRAMELRIKAVEYLMNNRPWDLFVVNYRATDNIQHHFWHYMDAAHPAYDEQLGGRLGGSIYEVYARLDTWLGTVGQRLGPDTTLIVMSDHGAGPASAKAVYYNRWLAQEGWLAFASQGDHSWGGRLRGAVSMLMWKAVWGYLRKWLGKNTKDALRRLFPGWYDRARSPASYFAIDWKKTQAYSDEFRDAIWINLIGREPQGIVEPGTEYENVRAEIMEGLLNWRDPENGLPVVEQVYRREDLYHGAHVDRAPDLTVTLRQEPFYRSRLSHTTNSIDPVQTLTRDQLLEDSLPQGLHRSNGIILLDGPNIKRGQVLEGADIMDLAPTILHLLGMAIPTSMDGKVLRQALKHLGDIRYTEDEPDSGAVGGGYSEDEEEAVRQQLSGLGYLG